MKLISFLSAVSLATVFATSGFGNLPTLFESANTMVAHDPNAPDDYSTGTSKSHDMRLRQLEQSQGDAKSPPSPSDIVINSPHGCMEHGFSLEAEFLWWRATLDNLEYAVKGKQSFIGFAGLSLSSEVKGVDFEFDPGVRVSAGFDFGRHNWDIALRWTYHYTSPTGSTGSDNPSLSVIPQLLSFEDNGSDCYRTKVGLVLLKKVLLKPTSWLGNPVLVGVARDAILRAV